MSRSVRAPVLLPVEAEARAVDSERLLDQLPVDAAAAHALAELGRVEASAAHFALTRQDALRLRRQTLAQTLLEGGRDGAGQSKEIYEGAARARFVRAFEKLGYVRVAEARYDGRDCQPDGYARRR